MAETTTFGDWLKEQRAQTGLSQEELAALSRYSRPYIARIETSSNPTSAKANPTPDAIRAFVRVLRANGAKGTLEEAFRARGLEVVPSESSFTSDSPASERMNNETSPDDEPSDLLLALRALFGFENVSRYHMPPFATYVSAGRGDHYQTGFPEEYDGPPLYRVKINGDSMGDGYAEGDEVIVQEASEARRNDDVVALYESQPIFKRCTGPRPNGKIGLKSLNCQSPHVPAAVPRREIRILGIARWVLMDRREAVELRDAYARSETERERIEAENERLQRENDLLRSRENNSG